MNTKILIGLIGSIRESANIFLETELERRGMKGLVASHGSILSVLYRNGGCLQMNVIAQMIHRSKSTVTELVNKLEKGGYVKKACSTEDRRVTNVCLTEKAQLIKKDFDEISDLLLTRSYQNFSETEKEELIKLLLKLKDNY